MPDIAGNKFTEYITLENDNFTNIAYKAYGDGTKFAPIIAANFGLPVSAFLPSGLKIIVPIIEEQPETDINLLPPWKRIPSETSLEAKAAVPVFLNIKTGPAGSFDESFD